MIRHLLQAIVLTLLAYLSQVTISYHIAFHGVAPNLALAILAIVSVALGKKYTFIMSLGVGYLIEIMMPSLNYFSIILYPTCAIISSLFFADKSERKLEEERNNQKAGTNMNAHIRTPLCAMVSAELFEGVHQFYSYLAGVPFTQDRLARALISIAYTTLAAGVLQFPIRFLLGTYKLPKAN